MRKLVALSVCAVLIWTACGRKKRVRTPIPPIVGSVETGIASWYGHPYHGRQSASGEIYDMETLTAAHRTLPFGTWVRVYNLTNDRRVEVRINDRGPFIEGRIIDLSHAAARIIEMIGPGTAPVRIEVIEAPVAASAPPAITPPAPSEPLPVPAVRAAGTEAAQAGASTSTPEEPQPPAAATPAENAPSGDWFAVQVGAFQNRSNAERIRGEMERLFGAAQLVERQGEPRVWRVLVGHEPDIAAANALAERIRSSASAEHRTAFVVRLDPAPAPSPSGAPQR